MSELGDSAGALDLIRRGERVAFASDHLYSKMVLAVARGYVLVRHGSPGEAVAVLEPAVATCRDKNFVGQLMLGLAALGHAYALTGRASDGIPLAKEAVALQEKTEAFVDRANMIRALAEAHLHAGDLANAEATAREGLGFAERHQERGWEGWLRWVLGQVAARRGDRASAERDFDAAQEIAEELGMRPLVERCRAGLGQLR